MNRVRVLLADDHTAVCKSVSALLQAEFDVVGTVANGRDLLAEADRLHPDVVVTDISMPLIDGIEAAQQLRVSNPQAKVIFLTIHDLAEFVRAGFSAGALGYVIKSHLTTDLIPAIHATLAGRQFISPVLQSQHAQRKEEPTSQRTNREFAFELDCFSPCSCYFPWRSFLPRIKWPPSNRRWPTPEAVAAASML
ncbi:MAG: response regulator transcription factor [Candidatus Korobacteraceae bacterium]